MDISKRIAEMKQQPGFNDNVGMILIHNGTVRSWSRKDRQKVVALEVTPDLDKIEAIRQEFLKRDGIYDIVAEAKTGRFQPGLVSCLLRLRVSSAGGTSCVMVDPAPMVAPSPTRTGATSCESEPINTLSPISVRCLYAPS